MEFIRFVSLKNIATVILFILLTSVSSKAIDLTMPKDDEDYWAKIQKLNWKDGPIDISFEQANSTISFNSEFTVLEGEDARQIMYWTNGIEFLDIEIYASNNAKDYHYTFSYVDSGYVEIDDWKNIDSEKFLEEMNENSQKNNPERTKNNMSTIDKINWNKKPTLDRSKNAVYYSFKLDWSDGTSTMNATSILLGRRGYTDVTYSSWPDNYDNNDLVKISEIHNFNDEQQYKDWKSGDKVAAVGIGALLAATLGVKALKPGLLVGLALLLKKFWFIILLPLAFIGKLFSSGSNKRKRK